MLFRIDFEIGVYPDRIQVNDRRSGRFVDFAAEIPFSTPDNLVADPIYLENALAKALRKSMKGGFILYDAQAHVVATQTMRPHERQAVRRALQDIGFKTLHFEGGDPDEVVPPVPSQFAALF